MNNIQKNCLALSCFLPLYFIFMFKNGKVVVQCWNENKTIELTYFDTIMTIVWIVLIVISCMGLHFFKRNFLKSQKKSKELVKIITAENITSEYFFTYFSLFVLTFFTVNPSSKEDVFILFLIMILMIHVYVKNEMYFINPMLNLMGYKSFSLEYQKVIADEIINANKIFKNEVFTEDKLCDDLEDFCYITFSPHDFSVCYKKDK